MRGPLVALSLIALPAALVAQRHGGVIVEKPAAPPARQPAREPHRGYGRDVYPAPIWVVAPRISMDSAVRIVERTYPGWFVDSKSLSHEYLRPIYLFTMIGAGQTGTRQL
ncbi:MAG TPA: hypothetical protein VFI13_04640, partial [Gemmatimonadales bacterium]|nr:hypothetical protein [Gemmatimonadales bacterium]